MPEFKVEGMTCQHCVKSVTQAVHRVDPTAKVEIDLAIGLVSISSTASAVAFATAIDDAGYTVLSGG